MPMSAETPAVESASHDTPRTECRKVTPQVHPDVVLDAPLQFVPAPEQALILLEYDRSGHA